MPRQNAIEKGLSAKSLAEFVEELAREPHLTLARIQALAAKRGIAVSLTGAARFRDKNFAAYLARLKAIRDTAMQIEAVQGGNAARSLADASAGVISQKVFELLNETDDADLTPAMLNRLTKIVALLRQGDQRAKELEARLAEYERKAADWARAESERKAAAEKVATSKKLSAAQREQKYREIFGLSGDER